MTHRDSGQGQHRQSEASNKLTKSHSSEGLGLTDLAVHSVVEAKMQHVGTGRCVQRVELRLQAVWQQVANVVLAFIPAPGGPRAPGSRPSTIRLPAWWTPLPNPDVPASGPNRRPRARPLPAPCRRTSSSSSSALARFGCSAACLRSRPWELCLEAGARSPQQHRDRPPAREAHAHWFEVWLSIHVCKFARKASSLRHICGMNTSGRTGEVLAQSPRASAMYTAVDMLTTILDSGNTLSMGLPMVPCWGPRHGSPNTGPRRSR